MSHTNDHEQATCLTGIPASNDISCHLSELLVEKGGLTADLVQSHLFSEVLNEIPPQALGDLSSTLQQLRLSQKRFQAQLESLAAENYSVFLEKSDASHSVIDRISTIVSSNLVMVDEIPNLARYSERFVDKARNITDAIKTNTKALEHHKQLLELLELPQLMETSIQNGYLDDAIAILTYTKRLSRKYGSTIPIVRSIEGQVNAVGSQLIQHLCNQLRSPLSLPACIKVIVFLRRTGTFTEQELRLKFLQTRTSCLENQLASGLSASRPDEILRSDVGYIKSGGFLNYNRAQYDAYWRATRLIDITRVQLFDIVTQYRAVFSEEENFMQHRRTSEWASGSTKDTRFDNNPLCLSVDLPSVSTSRLGYNLFHAWLTHRLGIFLDTFTANLEAMLHQPNLNTQDILDRWTSTGSGDLTSPDADLPALFTQLQALVSQSMYFGRSFSRIGCDFRPHLVDLFNSSILRYIKVYLTNATTEFCFALDNLLWTNNITQQTTGGEHSEDQAATINKLLCHPPMTLLYNRFMELFNGLRACCPVGLRHQILTAVVEALDECADRFVMSYRQLLDQQTINWRSEASAFAYVFTNILVPCVLSSSMVLLHTGKDAAKSVPDRPNSASHVLVHRLGKLVCATVKKTWPRIPAVPVLPKYDQSLETSATENGVSSQSDEAREYVDTKTNINAPPQEKEANNCVHSTTEE
ncbi:hypothetical protein CRM22_004862 [Opisthorchis felineus]|uniref:Conserved oligomeric Golgi complex subunit 8 n=1 Tax=Opisthorchis felineus TaxID=147828 RepID=A0A4V3SF69_OPIFE|nr:hypothetical protein CRM22_004862 [Opisthorchis felineus]